MNKAEDKKNNFSVALGLTDYGNPILYTITCLSIILNMDMSAPWNVIYIIGAVLSIAFGFMIPTVKLLIGLGKIEFKLPIGCVVCVNMGIFISGLALISFFVFMTPRVFVGIILISFLVLGLVYKQTKKFNTIAVLIGGIGYLLIYISLIALASVRNLTLSVVFYALAICLYLMLIGIGIKGNLKDARVHWLIEISNIACQSFVAIGTLFMFAKLG